MTDDPIIGTLGEEPDEEEERLDGVVLFDPDKPPLPPRPEPEPEPGQRGIRMAIAGLLPFAVLAGAYGVYRTGMLSPNDVVVPPLPIVAPLEGMASPASLAPVGRRSLSAAAGSSVVLEVRATGAAGIALPDSTVRFSVVGGGGLLGSEENRTDASGIARATLTLPARVGAVDVRAELVGSDLETSLTVVATAGAPERLVARTGSGQEAEIGELLAERVVVFVSDAEGNPVPNADVQFSASGEGMAAPSRTRTDSLGLASALWRLGMETGAQELAAIAVDLGSTVRFTANARPRPTLVESRPAPAEAGPVTVQSLDFVVGGSHVCTLVGGSASCRGANDRGQIAARSVGLRSLASGVAHVCGLNAAGEAVCWGANEGGQLGDGTRTDRPSPAVVRTELRFSTLTAGASHTCGLAGGGVPVCWGQNLSGQLGDGSRTDAWAPRAVGGGVTFRSLVAGWNHTCGLTRNGNAFCWGLNSEGQLGDGSRLDRLVPTLVRGSVESLAAGSAHTCGISNDEVLCWGDNRFGQLGDGMTESRADPGPVIGLSAAPVQLAAGAVHTCVLLQDRAVSCWGQNLHGQLGDGSTANRTRATPVAGGLRFASIHAGGALTCGFDGSGAQHCWGLNQNGQLGDGTRQSRPTPTLIQ